MHEDYARAGGGVTKLLIAKRSGLQLPAGGDAVKCGTERSL
jgi:hypothetical protein